MYSLNMFGNNLVYGLEAFWLLAILVSWHFGILEPCTRHPSQGVINMTSCKGQCRVIEGASHIVPS